MFLLSQKNLLIGINLNGTNKMKLINPILITLNNTLHIKADNLDKEIEVDSSCVDKLIDDVWLEKRKTRLLNEIPNAINLMEGINISELSDRIEVNNTVLDIVDEKWVYVKRAFLLPAKEDNQIHNCPTCGSKVEIKGNTTMYYQPIKSYTIEEIENVLKQEFKDAKEFGYELTPIHIINRFKK